MLADASSNSDGLEHQRASPETVIQSNPPRCARE